MAQSPSAPFSSSQSSPQAVQRLLTPVAELCVLHRSRSHFLCFCHLRANSIFQSITETSGAFGGNLSKMSASGASLNPFSTIGLPGSSIGMLETLERIGHPIGFKQTDEYMDGKWTVHSFCQSVFSRFNVSHSALDEFSHRQISVTSRHAIVLNHKSACRGRLSRSRLTTTNAARVGAINGELDFPVAFFEVRCSRWGTTSRARPFLCGAMGTT
mmetsp:Transcript_76096/g.168060  ORF Transcript_76096/g.168060 Transcript_76096/m.168060 type:complete len:214 (+) Transcript_76096:636-1277(+)